MELIKLNPSKFKKRNKLAKKSALTHEELVKKHSLSKKIENCKTYVDKNLYLHITK